MGVTDQFALPHGLLGRLVGGLMAKANAAQIGRAVDEVAPGAGERVLEIGFGPGVGLLALARRAPGAELFGADPSPTMVAAARRRLQPLGVRAELREATAAELPWQDASFDAVCAVNNAQLWVPRDGSLAQVRRVLRPGGRLVLSVHRFAVLPGGGHAGPGFDRVLLPAVREAGFTEVEGRWQPTSHGKALTVRAVRP